MHPTHWLISTQVAGLPARVAPVGKDVAVRRIRGAEVVPPRPLAHMAIAIPATPHSLDREFLSGTPSPSLITSKRKLSLESRGAGT